MKCEKCGFENGETSKFCEKCGNNLKPEVTIKIKEPIKKENKTSKKSLTIISLIVLVIAIIAIIVLVILLNNPLKKVEDYIDKFYTTYDSSLSIKNKNNRDELIKIGNILRSNKNNEKIVTNIENTFNDAINKWIANFNREYNSKDELDIAYEKLDDALKCIYTYYNGIVIMDEETYNSLSNSLDMVYRSKQRYLNGLAYEEKNNLKRAYDEYKEVIEDDSYYKLAQKFINDYVKDAVETFKEKANEYKYDEQAEGMDKYKSLTEKLTYVRNNSIVNNIDISKTQEYISFKDEVENEFYKVVAEIVVNYAMEDKVLEAISILEDAQGYVTYNDDIYNKLAETLKEYQNKKPVSLVQELTPTSTSFAISSSSFAKTINDVEYDSYISLRVSQTNLSTSYNLNKEYLKFKTIIVKDNEATNNIKGTIVIYADDKEIYRKDIQEINNDSIVEELKDVTTLKIEFIASEENTNIGSYEYIYLVEPYLYK